MIGTLQWDSLACRTKASLLLLYKINGGLVEVPTTMVYQSDRHTRGVHKFRQIQSNKDKFSLFPNTIPGTSLEQFTSVNIALSPNLESFKSGISTFIHIYKFIQIYILIFFTQKKLLVCYFCMWYLVLPWVSSPWWLKFTLWRGRKSVKF